MGRSALIAAVVALTSAALPVLAKFPRLNSLTLWKVDVTPEAVEAFKFARPECRVYYEAK